MLTGPAQTVRFARHLRKEMTLPEVILWSELRRRPAGLKFRRQHPAGPYVLDFFCATARLAVEVDGEMHGRGARPARDAVRDEWLVSQGVRVLRLPAPLVLDDVAAAVEHIVAVGAPDQPLHPRAPRGGPPPRDKLGEEQERP